MNESSSLYQGKEYFFLLYSLINKLTFFRFYLNLISVTFVQIILRFMKKIVFIGFIVLGITACSEAPTSQESNKELVSEHNEEVTEVVVANSVMTMEVDGMVCKMGCGGGIRKELKATGGVSLVEFDFEEERKSNIATIYFDQAKISSEEMIKVVSEMNDKQFKVGETSIDDYAEANSDEDESTSSSNSETVIESYSPSVELPNLLDLLSGLFT